VTGVDLEAAHRGVQRQGFTDVAEAAFRKTIADLATAAQAEGLALADALSAITTGGQTAVIRVLARFGEHEDADALAELACGVVRELAPIAFEEELRKRAEAEAAGSA
jgi:hypothetical protein